MILGDIWQDKAGYQRHGKDKYVHRTVAAIALGRELVGKECVHHINFIKADNTPSNLVVCPNQKYHFLLHVRQRIINLGGDPYKDKYCSSHKCLHSREVFSPRPSSYDGLHNTCRDATNKYRKDRGVNRNKFDWKAKLNQQYRRVFGNYTKRKVCQL